MLGKCVRLAVWSVLCCLIAADASAQGSDPAVVGRWGEPVVLQTSLGPIVPIHMAMLRNGHVLMWSRYVDSISRTKTPTDAVGTTPEAFEWTTTGATTHFLTSATNLFCAGHSFLPDGRLLVVGGHMKVDGGVADANIMTPGVGWTHAASMTYSRWYASSIALPSGEALIAGGTYGGEQDPNPDLVRNTPEVFQVNGTWRQLTGASGAVWFKYYPWNHVLSDGIVFYTGATNTTTFVDTSGAGSVTNGPSRAPVLRDYGTSVMYDQDRILVVGGGTPPQKTAGKIDVSPANRGTATWQPAPLTYPRKLHNATILPNGQVLVTGGTTVGGDPGFVSFEETWQGPALLGDTTNKALQIAIAPFADGRLDVYMIGLDHVIWRRWQDTNGGWQPTSYPNWVQVGTLKADEIAVSRLPNGSAELLMMDHTNQNVWHINIPPSGTASGSFLQVGNNTNKAKHVAIAPFGDGRLDFYMVGLDDVMWHSLGTIWTKVGSRTACSSCARPMIVTRRPDDSSEVTMIDGNGNIWHDWISASGTDHAFRRIGDATNKALQIAVAPFLDGRLDVYMIGLDARAWHIWQTGLSSTNQPGGVWNTVPPSNFLQVGTDQVSAIAPVRLFDGHSDVFVVRVADGRTYHTNGDNAAVYPNAHTAATDGTFKPVDVASSSPTQIIAAPYLRNVNGVRLDSRAAIVSLGSDQNMRYNYQPNGPVFSSELWDPVTGTWTTTAAMQIPRTYHSSTVLLRDGRVLSAGGGAGGQEPDHPNAEIYSPPYLFKGIAQPIISAPTIIYYGTQFTVNTNAVAANVSSVSLLGLSTTTHSFNQGQHFNSLSFSAAGSNSLTVSAPANANITPPGVYMLFVLDRGVPSVAAMVQVRT
jgi:hypothetical protein